MSMIKSIIDSTIETLYKASNTAGQDIYLCDRTWHDSDNNPTVTCIHGLLQTMSCRFHRDGILSLLYDSNRGEYCIHRQNCPYLIAHSIYLWVVSKENFRFPDGKKFREEELKSTNCGFMHVTKVPIPGGGFTIKNDYLETRNEVFAYLDSRYGDAPWSECPVHRSVALVYNYYTGVLSNIIRKLRNSETTLNFDTLGMRLVNIHTFNITDNNHSTRIAPRQILRTNNNIFRPLEMSSQGEAPEPRAFPSVGDIPPSSPANKPVMSAQDSKFGSGLDEYADDEPVTVVLKAKKRLVR